MEFFLFFFIAISLLYLLLISFFIAGLSKRSVKTEKKEFFTGPVSVVIPFRNEKTVLPGLLQKLSHQQDPGTAFEVILSDDHSVDGSGEFAREFCRTHPGFRYLAPEGGCEGKKAVLKRAVIEAHNDWIIQIDADVTIGPRFIEAHCRFDTSEQYDLLSAPVVIASSGFFSDMEALEFMSLNASGAGSFGIGHPIMCNGANLAFSREKWLKAAGKLSGEKSQSGDDMFLLHRFKKEKRKMAFLSDRDAVAFIRPADSLSAFLNQRARWSSKSIYYKDPETLFTALIVYLNSLFFLAAVILSITGKISFLFPAGVYLAKCISDFILLSEYSRITSQRRILRYFFPVSLIHYFYIVITPLIPLFGSVRWKGRQVNKSF